MVTVCVNYCFMFAGETVSLVDVDISQRGRNSPHPPTPPPPPRRSLSLLGTHTNNNSHDLIPLLAYILSLSLSCTLSPSAYLISFILSAIFVDILNMSVSPPSLQESLQKFLFFCLVLLWLMVSQIPNSYASLSEVLPCE